MTPRTVKLEPGKRVLFFLIDCMRLDQWRALESVLSPLFEMRRELACGILPTFKELRREHPGEGWKCPEVNKRRVHVQKAPVELPAISEQ